MDRSTLLDLQIKNNSREPANSLLHFLGNLFPTVKKNTGRSKETYVETQKTKAWDLKIEGKYIYFLYILGPSLVFGWIFKSLGPYAFAIPCGVQRKTDLFSSLSLTGLDKSVFLLPSNLKKSYSMLKALLCQNHNKGLCFGSVLTTS